MNGLTLSPVFGWIISPLLAVLVIAAAVGHVMWMAGRRHVDATKATYVRRMLAAVTIAVMLVTPGTVRVTQSKAVNATDVFIAVDITGSMAVSDAHYGSSETITRIEAARRAVADITRLYPDASFAAVGFGTSGTLDVPLTPDARAITNWADALTLEPTSSSAGSNLDKAIDPLLTTMKSAHDQHPDDTMLVYYISDGEQTSTKTRRTFSSLRAYADDAVTVGVGSAKGGRIPQIDNTGAIQANRFVTDPTTRQPGVSMLDEKSLKAIADEMSGSYVHVDASRTLGAQDADTTSKDYRMANTHQDRERVVPLVWPFAMLLTLLLAWEAVDWARTSRRLL
ncbi:VWA domain-containing protein [Bifidobacterium sp. SMB2]|uniref:VWA domain-containing protein n=1 Tax=Bifidobacterium saimiriisciurei TaxID=2661627 RepID=A0ABX0C9V5_9BIFI|nr:MULTISPECIES: vWA domain-containing protein [Bifidobacterium]NEG95605.1 VWA domain-containing protein [Bifidobacterium sp. SMB2]NEH11918.1 VWA domain-containing protein [Bifidobacterium saimiriisciurei]